MNINTHKKIDQSLCGKPVFVESGKSRVELQTNGEMVADDLGLVHGGFIFGLADYAAMIAVNDPNVVLGSAETKFLSPVKAGEIITADAVVEKNEGKKRMVTVTASSDNGKVFEGIFTCFVLKEHVLKDKGKNS